MEWGNLRNWLTSDLKSQEHNETRILWERSEAAWKRSPLGRSQYSDLIRELIRPLWVDRDPLPASSIIIGLCVATHDMLLGEPIYPIEPDWPVIDGDTAVAVRVRDLFRQRELWASDYERRMAIVGREFGSSYRTLLDALPRSCSEEWEEGEELFEVPLVELLDDPTVVITSLIHAPFDPEVMRLGMFSRLRETLIANVAVASGYAPDADLSPVQHRLIYPAQHKDQTPSRLVDVYLARTPFEKLLESPVPFRLPPESRFEHTHIIGGTGHGKTQLLQRMIHADLVAAKSERRSVVVIDSQGDLINKLTRLALFDPDNPASLANRLVLIDPADVEFPAALNLFDAHVDRVRDYSPADRERVLNGVIELYEVFFGAMLGAELTQKQGVIFRYLARLMLTIPGATIHTLMQLMEDGKAYKPQMEALDGSARYFFQTEFFHPSFAATKKQILKRLWGVLSTPAFERMFAQEKNKLDLFTAMNEGKIILVSTAKDLLKQDGSALFGRFFIAMLAQAALERSTLDPDNRTPTFVYVDEAQEYFDDSVETILTQARKYRVGITIAHQALDQLSTKLRASILSNTSLKCAGGVSNRDARALADELHTTTTFIESMRRRPEKTEFAVWLKQTTPGAIRMAVPLGFLERQPLLGEDAYGALLRRNRERYCGTLGDVLGFPVASVASARHDASVRPDPVQPEPASAQRAELPPVVESKPSGRATEPSPIGEAGKGGPQHRYVQHLVKGLGEARGFRAVIEEAAAAGQIDVGLHRSDLSIACEISVSSTPSYEAKNLAKCLAEGFTHVFAIATNQKRLKAIEKALGETFSADERARIHFLTPDVVADALDAFAPPSEEQTVRGYRVKVSRTFVSETEATDRHTTVARVIAQSLNRLPDD